MIDEHKTISHIDFKVLSTVDIIGRSCYNTECSSKQQSLCTAIEEHDINIKKIIIKPTVVKIFTEKIVKQVDKDKKRIVSKTNEWKDIDTEHLELDNQFKFVEDKNTITDIVSRELRKKISSYKSQDRRKNIYNDDEFIDYDFVINLFKESQLKCYYCEKSVFVIYDNVRESKQWTIERIDNRIGHNKNNSVMSCLDCNLRRRTMYHERYIMTKKLLSVKLLKLTN